MNLKFNNNLLSNIFFIALIALGGLVLMRKIENFTVSRPSKCFDCEREITSCFGDDAVWQALPTKCFDCEKEALKNGRNPYHTGPTKCFSCEHN